MAPPDKLDTVPAAELRARTAPATVQIHELIRGGQSDGVFDAAAAEPAPLRTAPAVPRRPSAPA